VHHEAPVGFGRCLAGRDDHVLPTAALVRTHLAEDAALTLPEVRDAARRVAGRELDDQRPGLDQVEEVQDVRRGRVRRDEPEPVPVAHVVHEVGARRAEDVVVLGTPLGIGDQRQRPQVRLTRHLVIELVEDQLDIPTRRQLTVEPDLAQTTRQRPSLHWRLLRAG
jgi:hypothetical protein